MHRRDFLRAGVGASAMAALSGPVFAADTEKPLRVALIGAGWYGKTDLFHLNQVAPIEVVGLCDVDQHMLKEAAELVAQRHPSGNRPPTFGDYRKLLSDVSPEIVLIGTPDHWHCLPTVEACKAGADVYVQKPISWDVVEGQAMVAAARKYKRTVQVGLQRRSTPHLHEARDRFIKTGKLERSPMSTSTATTAGRAVSRRTRSRRNISTGRCSWDRPVGETTIPVSTRAVGGCAGNSATGKPATSACTSWMRFATSWDSVGPSESRLPGAF